MRLLPRGYPSLRAESPADRCSQSAVGLRDFGAAMGQALRRQYARVLSAPVLGVRTALSIRRTAFEAHFRRADVRPLARILLGAYSAPRLPSGRGVVRSMRANETHVRVRLRVARALAPLQADGR